MNNLQHDNVKEAFSEEYTSEDLHCLIAERHDLHIEHRTWSGNKSINGHNHLQTLFYDRFHMLEHHPCALPGNGGLLPLSFLLALYSFQIVDATSCTDEKKVYIARIGGKTTTLYFFQFATLSHILCLFTILHVPHIKCTLHTGNCTGQSKGKKKK